MNTNPDDDNALCEYHQVEMWWSWSSNMWQCDVCFDDWSEAATGNRKWNTPRLPVIGERK